MKKGDKLPVSIGGHVVAQAEITYIGEGRAELVFPATKVVMGVRTELEPTPTPVAETETVITGVDRPEPTAVDLPREAVVQDTPVPPPAAPVEAPVNNPAPATADPITEATVTPVEPPATTEQ